MGGPVISFLQGLVCLILYKKIKNGVASLFVLWLGISGLMAFFGYMMIAPFAKVGDTGRIFQLLEIPMVWQIIIALIFLMIFTFMLLHFHNDFERFIYEDIYKDKLKKAKWARLLVMYPVLSGIIITGILKFPIVVFLSILPSIMMPFMLFMIYGRMITSKNKIVKAKNKDVTNVSIPMIAFFTAVIILFRLLVFGITI